MVIAETNSMDTIGIETGNVNLSLKTVFFLTHVYIIDKKKKAIQMGSYTSDFLI